MGINKTYMCGTLRADCQGNPKELVKAKLKKGEMLQRSKDGFSVTKWKNNRDVVMISNKYSVEIVDVTNRRGESKPKPNVIRDYNDGMSGIDKADQMISYYDSLKKTTCRYKKVGLHIIDIYVFNSYALHSKFSGNKEASHMKFRESIMKCLIKDMLDYYVLTPQQSCFHYLEQLPSTEKKKLLTKRCMCQRKTHRNVLFLSCICLKLTLCVSECSKKYHSPS